LTTLKYLFYEKRAADLWVFHNVWPW